MHDPRDRTWDSHLRVDARAGREEGRLRSGPNASRLRVLRSLVASWLVTIALLLPAPGATGTTDPLPSWNDGAAKRAIVEFVSGVSRTGAPKFIPPTERIATFDNDGTLWAEQPMYFQLAFALDRVKKLALEHPEWKEKAALQGRARGRPADGARRRRPRDRRARDGDPRRHDDRRVREECIYQPKRELLGHLRANGFKTFIVSGGGVEFMRVWTDGCTACRPSK